MLEFVCPLLLNIYRILHQLLKQLILFFLGQNQLAEQRNRDGAYFARKRCGSRSRFCGNVDAKNRGIL
jgi:hypothetical protein